MAATTDSPLNFLGSSQEQIHYIISYEVYGSNHLLLVQA